MSEASLSKEDAYHLFGGEAPVIYDLRTDEYRPITQDEVDELCRIKVAYGNLRLMSQSILSESNKMALGQAHKDADRDLDAYMAGEDLRQDVEKEKRLNSNMQRYDSGEPIEQVLNEMETKRQERPFPTYGPTYARQAEAELVHRTASSFNTDGTYLDKTR